MARGSRNADRNACCHAASGRQEKMGNLQKKIEEISQMGKEPIIAVIERRGEVIYYKINRMNFYENKARLEEPFNL